MRSGVEVRVENTPSGTRIALAGELNIYAAAALKERLLPAIGESSSIEIDLSEVTEIDSAGLQLMILVKRQSRHSGVAVRLVGHSPEVVDLIELFNLAAFFGDPLVISRQETQRRQGPAAWTEDAR